MQELRGNLVLDTGVLFEYLIGSSPSGEMVKNYFASLGRDSRVHLSLNSISEIYYILCRSGRDNSSRDGHNGSKFALEKLGDLFESRGILIHNSLELALKTGQMKCMRSLSLADCSALALAESLRIPACFVRENELEREISKKPFDIEVVFLEK